MKKRGRYGVGVVLLLLILLCVGCSKSKQKLSYDVKITIPSKTHTQIAPGRHFSVRGTIKGDKPLPDDAVMKVTLKDGKGKIVRTVIQNQKENMKFDLFYPNLSYYEKNDPARKKLLAVRPPELLVKDKEHPEQSFSDATIKCYYDDTCFHAFFVSATDVKHGAIVEDHMNFTDENGKPYTALKEGKYVVCVQLFTKNGNKLAQDTLPITIAPHKDTIIARFIPESQWPIVEAWAKKTGYEFCADIFPGNTTVIDVEAMIDPMWHAVDIAIFNQGKTHFLAYNITKSSTSYAVELGHLQKLGVVDDTSRFAAYYYDIGEPKFTMNQKKQTGKITAMKPGDKMVLCRMDVVDDKAYDGKLDLLKSEIKKSTKDVTSRITVNKGERFALMGVLSPIQIEKDQVVFDSVNNEYQNPRGISKVVYQIDDGVKIKRIEKKVGLTRTYESGLSSTSEYEFYHVFDSALFQKINKDYIITAQAYDSKGDPVKGTKETFKVKIKAVNNSKRNQ